MNNKIKKKPDIRFKGFSDDWEQRKLGDIVSINSGKDYKHLSEGTIPVYGTGGYMLSVDAALSSKQDAIGIGRKGTIDKPYILKAPFWTVDTLFYAIPNENIDLNFTYSIFQKINWKKLDESTGVPSLSKSAINSNDISIPINTEQVKLGNFFKTLDDTIALHQRELDLMKQEKQTLLSKMFPKNGEQFPEIRIKGFTETWERRKLGEIVTQVIREVPKPNISYKRLSIRSHAKGTFHQFVEDPSKVAMDKLFVVKEDDLIVNITFAWEHAIAVANKQDDGLLVSHRFPTFRADGLSDINFIHYLITQESFRRSMDLISPGGAGRNRVLSKKDFVLMPVTTPNSIKEQAQIGQLFKIIDYNITLKQQQLDLMKTMKKSLLKSMFI